VKLSRAVGPLTEVARTGAEAAVATIVLAALASLLEWPRPPHGTLDLMALASRFVRPGSPADPDTVTLVAATAARGGSSRLVTEAARLHRIFTAR
jgi:hypothetical protein